jgi:NAD(P)-dependent dehydrogenase (short-subunit alcohol dehydrogenase family)
MSKLEGRRVLITGASRGVGFAAARAFAREGASLALLARPSVALDDAVARTREAGGSAFAAPADVTDRTQVERAVGAAIHRLGGLDLLVLNAAAVVYGAFEEVSADDFDHVIRASFVGAVDTVRCALPALQDSAGAIVATGSLMAKLPLPMFGSYAAAKHALRGFLTTLRLEQKARRTGVDVSIVHPGVVASPLWHQMTSATGGLPRVPPEGYSPDAVAEVLVSCALRPRPEVTVGGETKALELIAHVRPAAALMFRAMYAWWTSGREVAMAPGALWRPPPGADRGTRVAARPSVIGTLRTLPDRLPLVR